MLFDRILFTFHGVFVSITAGLHNYLLGQAFSLGSQAAYGPELINACSVYCFAQSNPCHLDPKAI